MTAVEPVLKKDNSNSEESVPTLNPPVTEGVHTSTPQNLNTPLEDVSTTAVPQTTSPRTEGPESEVQEPIDPNIAILKGMFPDFDVSVLQSVLESVGGNQEKAIDILLGMSDPSYTSTAKPDAAVTQTELDEQFARTLYFEEAERQRTSWRPHDHPEQLSYEARTSAQRPPHDATSSGDGDSMAQIQEQLGKFAETGKRTFTTLLSKVKAKIQEFDNPQGQSQGTQSYPAGSSQQVPQPSQPYYDPNPPPPPQRGYEVQPSSHVAIQPSTVDTQHPPTELVGTGPTSNTVDPAKIGLLPKRPVSLGSSPKPSKAGEDDDLEYVENPFEESSRH